jgi:hypothetical protein
VVIPVSHNDVPILVHCNSARLIELSRGYSITVLMALLASACQSGHTALWCDLADTVVGRVSHNEVGVPIHCDPPGKVKLSNGPLSVSMPLFASASQNGHMAMWCDLADTVVGRVRHDDVAVPIHYNFTGRVKLSNCPFTVSVAHLASACQSGHLALSCDLADTMVATITHDDVAVPIHCDSNGILELSNRPFSVSMALFAIAGQSGHVAL